MNGIVAIALANAASATVLALVVALASRFVRRPGLLHTLWLFVLLDLLAPPVVVVRVLPSVDALVPSAAVPVAAVVPRPGPAAHIPMGPQAAWVAPAPPPASISNARSSPSLPPLGSLWLAGSAAVLLLALARAVRFERALGRGVAAPGAIQARAAALARALGLARAPRVRLVAWRVSPMLWFRPGRMEIVFPARLLPRLGAAELDALLAHELAHVRRGDHWVRWIELAASALYFWHPVVWWARAALRRAEERACDAWVKRTLPSHSRDYAGGLIKTLEFLAQSGRPIPLLASGVGHFHRLEERLTMILKQHTPPFTTRTQRVLVGLAGLAFLLAFPVAAERRAPAPAEKDTDTEQAEAIETELRELEQRQIELSSRLRELHRLGEQEHVRQQVAQLESEGRLDEARQLETEAARAARQADLERAHEELERTRVEQATTLESEMHRLQREIERAAASGREEDVERQQRALAELEEELAARAVTLDRRAGELDQQAVAAELEAQAEQARLLEHEGDHEAAARLERELAQRAAELELVAAGRRTELERRTVEQEAERLARRAAELEGRGDEQQAREMRRRAAELDQARQGLEQRAMTQAIRAELERLAVQVARLGALDRQSGSKDAEIDELRQAIEELELELERLRGAAPDAGEVH